MKKKILILLFFAIFLFAIQWLFSHAYIELSLANTTNTGGITYKLLNQSNQETSEFTATSTKVKQLVRKGSYELLAQQNESSYFAVIDTGGFLATTTVSGELAPEKNRKFVGDNPGPCTHYEGQTLLSFGCDDTYSNIQIHVPANTDNPTYTRKSSGVIEGDIGGIVRTNEGSLVLIKAPEATEDQGAPYTLYKLNELADLSAGVALEDLNENKYYSLLAYKGGFIAYDNAFEQILYYASQQSKPISVSMDAPSEQDLKPYSLSAYGESIAVMYTNNREGEVADIHDESNAKIRVKLVVMQGNQTKQFTFSKQYSDMRLCGDNQLCLVSDKKLEVYDITGEKQKLLFVVGSVQAIENSKNGRLTVARDKDILDLNLKGKNGSIQYSLGDYEYCGIQTFAGGYTLCLINSRKNKVALNINQEVPNNDSIDKKVSRLLKIPEINDISIYGSHIFISPELGELIFNESTESFGYDPVKEAATSKIINEKVEQLGIDRAQYKILNTLE